ncbi:RNA polymerase sigma-70 factor [Sinomicrobium soli]|uniref:RNA polymerase sigma-70 factor n=1 Tax=Sinomicrobium sp. N-1-3-6 TaxID=2219864 RepID=UPI0013750B25|nr:RNA polymerase sigma-70 factor [Sinomicrobium sp. N-1-3-6]
MSTGSEQDYFTITARSFSQLYENYWKQVFGICYHYTGDTAVAQELTQNIFESLWKRRRTLQIMGEVKKYLFKAAKLAVNEYFRNKYLHQEHLKALETVPADINDTEEKVHYDQLTEEIEQLLARMPEKTQEIYNLKYEQGAPQKEIAKSMDISEKAVEYHLHKATRFLRLHLVDFR